MRVGHGDGVCERRRRGREGGRGCRRCGGLVEATDAMCKAANVEIIKTIQIGGAYVTTLVKGDVGSVRAAVEAGAEAAGKVGELISSHVIARPHADLLAGFGA